MRLSTFQFKQLTKGYTLEIEHLISNSPHYSLKRVTKLNNLNFNSNEIGILKIQTSNTQDIIQKADRLKLHYYLLKNNLLIFPNTFKFTSFNIRRDY